MNRAKNFWILLLLLMTGIVLGGFIGNMASGVRGLSWLNYGQSFGLMDPVVLDLGILVITFGLSIRVTMASIIGVDRKSTRLNSSHSRASRMPSSA